MSSVAVVSSLRMSGLVEISATKEEATGAAHQLAAAVLEPRRAVGAEPAMVLVGQRALVHGLFLWRLRCGDNLHGKRLAQIASRNMPRPGLAHRMRYGLERFSCGCTPKRNSGRRFFPRKTALRSAIQCTVIGDRSRIDI